MICNKCGENKEIIDFPLIGGGRRRKRCKKCHSTYVKLFNRPTKKQIRKNTRKYLYGLTNDEYNHMLEEQKECCFICKEKTDILCIDHNHLTGNARGLLCIKCNTLLGNCKEDVKILISAISYLEFFNNNNEKSD